MAALRKRADDRMEERIVTPELEDEKVRGMNTMLVQESGEPRRGESDESGRGARGGGGGRATGEEKHIGHDLFITRSSCVDCFEITLTIAGQHKGK
ncbi:uncharacterized protein LOC144055571 isoform X2 [Vanacampus margaritifer]